MFWTDLKSRKIFRALMDGSNVTTLISTNIQCPSELKIPISTITNYDVINWWSVQVDSTFIHNSRACFLSELDH